MVNSPYIIAEASQGYEGSLDISKLLVKGAAKGKADAIKFQVVFAEDLAEPGYQYYDLFKQLEMSTEAWKEIRNEAKHLGLDFVVDVFGRRSLELARTLDVDGFKLHSTTFFDVDLAEQVLAEHKTTYISIGGIEAEEVDAFVEHHQLSERDDVKILFGFQSEPTPIDKNNLARIAQLRERYSMDIGFMDHSEGSSPDSLGLSLVALGCGVKLFEKHITLDRELELEDYVSGITPSEFLIYTDTLKRLSLALGTSSLELTDEEVAYRGRALKRVVASHSLEKGSVIGKADYRLSRPVNPGGCYLPEDVIGKSLNIDLKEGDPIDKEYLS